MVPNRGVSLVANYCVISAVHGRPAAALRRERAGAGWEQDGVRTQTGAPDRLSR